MRSFNCDSTGAKHSSLVHSCESRLPSATIRYFARFGVPSASYLIQSMAIEGRGVP